MIFNAFFFTLLIKVTKDLFLLELQRLQNCPSLTLFNNQMKDRVGHS
jgi:hypothetical protein